MLILIYFNLFPQKNILRTSIPIVLENLDI